MTARSSRRATMHALRQLGCTCNPTIAPPTVPLPLRAIDGVMVRHESGCPLGDEMTRWNSRGVLPVLYSRKPGCER